MGSASFSVDLLLLLDYFSPLIATLSIVCSTFKHIFKQPDVVVLAFNLLPVSFSHLFLLFKCFLYCLLTTSFILLVYSQCYACIFLILSVQSRLIIAIFTARLHSFSSFVPCVCLLTRVGSFQLFIFAGMFVCITFILNVILTNFHTKLCQYNPIYHFHTIFSALSYLLPASDFSHLNTCDWLFQSTTHLFLQLGRYVTFEWMHKSEFEHVWSRLRIGE